MEILPELILRPTLRRNHVDGEVQKLRQLFLQAPPEHLRRQIPAVLRRHQRRQPGVVLDSEGRQFRDQGIRTGSNADEEDTHAELGSHRRGDRQIRSVRARPVLVKAVLANCSSLTTFRLVRCSCIYNLRILCGPDLKRFKTVVQNCSDYDSVAIINAPSLCSFRYLGKICEFRIQCHMERLNDVAFEIEHSKDFRMLPHKKEMVVGIAYVRHLTISSAFLEGLTAKFEEMEFYFWRLLKLQVTVASESYINPSDIANFLKKCPRIENVYIDVIILKKNRLKRKQKILIQFFDLFETLIV
ncbi:hypothetical protein ACP275_09G043600 [Erythranthe tilingii]